MSDSALQAPPLSTKGADGVKHEEEGPEEGVKEETPPLVHVRFSFDRIPMRRMHAALQHACHPFFQLLPASLLTSRLAHCPCPWSPVVSIKEVPAFHEVP